MALDTLSAFWDKPAQAVARVADGFSGRLYASVASEPFTHASLQALFVQALANNERHGITGTLVVDGRLIVQWIEGPAAQVERLWELLQSDPRHHCVVLLHAQTGAPKRLFAKWAMMRGRTDRAEIIQLVRRSFAHSRTTGADWAQAIAPLQILLDGAFQEAYSREYAADVPARSVSALRMAA